MRFLLFICFLLLIVVSCSNNKTEPSKEADTNNLSITPPSKSIVFDQLLGTWQGEDGKTFERWTKINDSLFESSVYNLKGKDTIWNESAKVFPESSTWIFETIVKGQNAGKAVRFTSSSVNESSVTFSNPAHDFPTDISYNLPDKNTVNAFIVGPNSNGGKDTIPYNYKRLQ